MVVKGIHTLVPLALLAGLCTVTWGQEKSPPAASPAGQVITGCLDKGTSAGEYVLIDEKTGNKTTVIASSSVDLTKHAAKHKVKLSGTVERAGGRPVFKVDEVEHVSNTCSPPAEN